MNEGARLREGNIGIIPTDTIYGIAASAKNEAAVMRVYAVKKRTPAKPCIILISSILDLADFGISISVEQAHALSQYWPGPVSVIMACGKAVPEYLHRGTHTLAFRLPDSEQLLTLLKESGPLIAPSANPEGYPPAQTIAEAKEYFGTAVDFYIDGGVCVGLPSTVIELHADGSISVVREGRKEV